MFFHLGYRCDGNGQARIEMCSRAHPRMKGLFAECGELVPPPLNDMEVPAHILDGWTEDVAMATLNPSMGREYVSMSQVEGDQTFTPLQTT
jgi:hypothetical protein